MHTHHPASLASTTLGSRSQNGIRHIAPVGLASQRAAQEPSSTHEPLRLRLILDAGCEERVNTRAGGMKRALMPGFDRMATENR
jgi:hypothetical protein